MPTGRLIGMLRIASTVSSGDIPGLRPASASVSDNADDRRTKLFFAGWSIAREPSPVCNASSSIPDTGYKENGDGGCSAGLGSACNWSLLCLSASETSSAKTDEPILGVSMLLGGIGGKYGLWLPIVLVELTSVVRSNSSVSDRL